MTKLTLGRNETAELATAEVIRFTFDKKPLLAVAPGDMKPALAALKVCQDDLLKGWGVDPNERDRVGPTRSGERPWTEARRNWISYDDYPFDAIKRHQQGAVTILWAIGIDGRVRDCHAVVSSGVPLLDKAACAALTAHAKYSPVLDKEGKPMVVHAMRRVVWTLPSGDKRRASRHGADPVHAYLAAKVYRLARSRRRLV